MKRNDRGISRRGFLRHAAGLSIGAISARGIYGFLDTVTAAEIVRPAAATPARRREQYLVADLEVIADNGAQVIIPPLYHEVITAKLATGLAPAALFAAQARLERALRLVEEPHAPTAAGLTIVAGWGLPYFRRYIPAALVEAYLPVDLAFSAVVGERRYTLLDAVRFPGDRDEMLVEQNEVVFLLRSDNQATIAAAERALFEEQDSQAYVGDLFALTSVRKGFVGRGFGTRSIAKQLALAAGVPGAEQIPDSAQLMMGFTSAQHGALAPDNLVSFETLPGITDQGMDGYFAGGTTMHLSHLFEDLGLWYGSFTPAQRVARMFSPRTFAAPETVTLPNDATHRSTRAQVLEDATGAKLLGHNATIQQANRLLAGVVDNYGRHWPAGTPISLRDDFNTLDNPFAWTSNPDLDQWSQLAAPGLHFVAFTATSQQFHATRLAMAGVLPDGTNLRESPYNIPDSANGINHAIRATHRQNFLIPSRERRSFPLVEMLAGIKRQFLPLVGSR
jgi:hypothetical protein